MKFCVFNDIGSVRLI